MEKWPGSLSGTVSEPTELMLESTTEIILCVKFTFYSEVTLVLTLI
jgi:hypothetical protein